MANIDEIRKNREEKLKKLKIAGMNPYPTTTKREKEIKEVLKDFKIGKEVIVAGRMRLFRGHGGAIFFDIEDGTGKIQILFKKDKIGEKGFKFFS